jgi:putative transposase
MPPKYAVSNVVGFIKGKNAISIAITFRGKSKSFISENFGQEEMIRNYIRKQQEQENESYEQLSL